MSGVLVPQPLFPLNWDPQRRWLSVCSERPLLSDRGTAARRPRDRSWEGSGSHSAPTPAPDKEETFSQAVVLTPGRSGPTWSSGSQSGPRGGVQDGEPSRSYALGETVEERGLADAQLPRALRAGLRGLGQREAHRQVIQKVR